MLSIKTIISL